MAIVFRPARLEDLEGADALVVRSINDLTERHGFGPMLAPRPPRFQQFSLKDDPDGPWVAEDADQLLGFAFSWVCGDLWFLAQLGVLPGTSEATLNLAIEHGMRITFPLMLMSSRDFGDWRLYLPRDPGFM